MLRMNAMGIRAMVIGPTIQKRPKQAKIKPGKKPKVYAISMIGKRVFHHT
jgi:hypothetical protein